MRYAIIGDGLVENIALAEKADDVSSGIGRTAVAAPDGIGPGDSFDGTRFGKKAVVVPPITGEAFAMAVKAECQRRIFAVVGQSAQQRLQNHYSMGKLSAAQRTVFEAGNDWIDAMVTKCRDLVTARDQSFREDRHWPVPDPDIVTLASRF